MSVITDFALGSREDAVLNISLAPATAVSAWNIQFQVQHRFGGISGIITKSCASGYGGGQSGITILNSGEGRFRVAINSVDTSGLDYSNYWYRTERLDSGSRTIINEGAMIVLP